jgi:hypothetical protein
MAWEGEAITKCRKGRLKEKHICEVKGKIRMKKYK